MHIADGILDYRYCIAGYVAAGALTAVTVGKTRSEEIPKISIMGAAFFVASLIHVRIGFTSIHLTLIGLTGIVLGRHALLAIGTGLLFQTILFQHGGITTLGVNTIAFSLPAMLAGVAFRRLFSPARSKAVPLSVGAGVIIGLCTALTGAIIGTMLFLSAGELAGLASVFSIAQLSLSVLEGMVGGAVVYHILRTNPSLLEPERANAA